MAILMIFLNNNTLLQSSTDNCCNSTLALTIDSSQNATFTGDVSLPDSKKIKLKADDLQLFHNGSSSVIRNETGHLDIKIKATMLTLIHVMMVVETYFN